MDQARLQVRTVRFHVCFLLSSDLNCPLTIILPSDNYSAVGIMALGAAIATFRAADDSIETQSRLSVQPMKTVCRLLESYTTQLEGQIDVIETDLVDAQEYSFLHEFGTMTVGEFNNLEDVMTDIRGSALPKDVANFMCGLVNATMSKCSNSVDYTADEKRNGGTGFEYCIFVHPVSSETEKKVLLIYTVAGREFKVNSEVLYLKVDIPEKIKLSKQGFFREYTEEELGTRTDYKMIVRPVGVTQEEFTALVHKTYVKHAHNRVKSQLKAQLQLYKGMLEDKTN